MSAALPAPDRAGTLLDGRVRYRQLAQGHRTGIEPVLLAALVPARPGEHVLEAGTGAGAGLLCLFARVPDLRGTGLEADPALAALARDNLGANGWGGRGTVAVATLPAMPTEPIAADHAFANPPWFDAASTPSVDPGRRLARVLPSGALDLWVGSLAGAIRRGGTVSLALGAPLLPAGLAALAAAGFGAPLVFPLWPRAGVAARLVLLRGRKGARGAAVLAAGLVLHEADGRYTAAAERVLRGGEALAP